MTGRVRVPALLVAAAVLLGGYLAFGIEHREVYRGNSWNTALLYAHIAGGSLMVVLGPFLLSRRSRRGRSVAAHRWLGRAYLVGVLFAGLGGLYVARLVEYGGPLSRLAFACALSFWLLSGYLAYRRVREKAFRAHKGWMVRNYAITASFLTHGAWVALLTHGFAWVGLDPEVGKTAGDWWAWTANLAVAELLLRGRLRPRRTAVPVADAKEGSPLGQGGVA